MTCYSFIYLYNLMQTLRNLPAIKYQLIILVVCHRYQRDTG